MFAFLQALWALALDAAPWLVFGFLVGGLFKTLIPMPFLQRHLSGKGVLPIFKATILGMPLPLCSCGVIPAAMGLREAGASRSATTAFLVSTPETGVDSVSISYVLLGPVMAVIRPVAAFFSAMITGLLIACFVEKNANAAMDKTDEQGNKDSLGQPGDCCATSKPVTISSVSTSFIRRLWSGVHYTFTQLYFDILKWLIIGLLFAAAVQSLLPPAFLAEWGKSPYALLVMAVIGVPMYVCATASTPIAAGLLLAGVSPGAIMVFLMAGPATNVATIGVIREKLGSLTMLLYLAGVVGSALVTGWIVNLWLSVEMVQAHLHHAHQMLPFVIQLACLMLLVGLALMRGFAVVNANRRRVVEDKRAAGSSSACCSE